MNLGDERFRRRGSPSLWVDHDGVDLHPQILCDGAARRANSAQRRFANHNDIDVVWKVARLADKAACPRAVDKRDLDALDATQSVAEAPQYADCLEQNGAKLRCPRQFPIWADEPVAAQQSGYQESVLFESGYFPARRCLRDACAFGNRSDGEFVSRAGEENPEYPKLLIGPEERRQSGRRHTHTLDNIVESVSMSAPRLPEPEPNLKTSLSLV